MIKTIRSQPQPCCEPAGGDTSLQNGINESRNSACIRCGPLQSTTTGPSGDLATFCSCLKEKRELAERMKARCRQPGEYDPAQNPCARIPGQHPFCPPGQTIGILPKGTVEDIPRALNKPSADPPPRLPWRQCIENVLVNDQVRRPLARWSHIRELPPIVVPEAEITRIRESINAVERKKAECEAAARERECARQASYQRHSEWNYTVDSLLARKKKAEEAKAKAEEMEFQQLTQSIQEGRESHSKQMQARAKEQLLHRKGLIRDLHAAMAKSKAMQEIEDIRKKSSETSRPNCKFPEEQQEIPTGLDENSPILKDSCMKRLILENYRPEYTKKEEKKDFVCSEERLMLLKCDEGRVAERKAELAQEKEKLKKLRTECPLPWPEPYIKYIEEPPCGKEEDKCKKQQKLRDEHFLEIHDKLASDAFIDYHEKEIERQASEYNEYKRKVDRMRKEKEKQLIDEKVQGAIRNSEIAAKMWEEVNKKKVGRPDEYSKLKDIWEAEHAKKEQIQKAWRDGLSERVTQDFLSRRDNSLCKRALMNATREWEKECCLAHQNYELQCEKDNRRRERAKELQKYHVDQIANKVAMEEEERFMNAAYGEKTRLGYAIEMREMKDYANAQIQEWKAKGRSIGPMLHAMKKWDYDGGMTPELWARTPLCGEPRQEEIDPKFESTAMRLGFDRGAGGDDDADEKCKEEEQPKEKNEKAPGSISMTRLLAPGSCMTNTKK